MAFDPGGAAAEASVEGGVEERSLWENDKESLAREEVVAWSFVADAFEVTTPHVIYALLGGFIVLFGMFSLFLRERLYVGEAVWAFIFGIVIGPYCANIFNPRAWSGDADSDEVINVITLEFTRIVLAIGVFAIGVELPKAYMKKHWRSLFFLLVPVMTWGWFVSAGLIYALIPGLNFLSSLAVAACLTPTDPILAAAVVGGKWADKHVPAHIRHLLAAESGCNDGAAFPFLFIALYLIIDDSTGAAIRDWFLLLWLYQVVLGAIIGSMLGFGFRHLMKFCQRHDLIDRHSYVAQYVSLAIFTIGVTTLLGSDDLLSAFFCGTAFAWDGFFNRQTEESVFSSVIDTLFNVAAFIFVGAWMPFNKFEDAALTLSVWRLVVIAILVLLLRRLPIMVLTYRWIPDIKTLREAIFSGHFGPIGVGAIFISTLAVEVLHSSPHTEENPQTQLLADAIQPIVAFMVLCSIVLHGLSIPSFSLGRRVHSVSRTWSRRDTQGSVGAPEWQNQARMVSRAEDIVINRDRADLDVDVERGEGSSRLEGEKDSVRSSPSLSVEAEAEKMADSGLTDETRVAQHPGGGRTPREASPERAQPQHPHVHVHDYREQSPPDGTDNVMEWIEGSHRVIEKKMGPGSDVEVTVLPNPDAESSAEAQGSIPLPPQTTWRGKVHELEAEIRPAVRRELAHLTSRAREAVASPTHLHNHAHAPHPGDAGDAEVLEGDEEDEDEEGWASEGSNGPLPPQAPGDSIGAGRKTSRSSRYPHPHLHAAQRKRRPAGRRGSVSSPTSPAITTAAGAPEIVEEPRGRRADPSVTFASVQHPNEGLNTSTSAGSGRMGRLGTPPSAARGGGAGQGGNVGSNARHNRLESIRAMHTSAPPSRDSSPSRSVRFAEGRGTTGAPTPPSGGPSD